MKVFGIVHRTHNPSEEAHWVSRLRENLTSGSDGEGLETGRLAPRQSFTRQAAFKELKQDIGSADTQSRHPEAVKNHLHFSMMAMSVAWIYASRYEKVPQRHHAVGGRRHFAFSDVRRLVAKAALNNNFAILFPEPRKRLVNSFLTSLLRLAA